MNSYKVETICNIYGKMIKFETAQTPYDAAEKATKHMSWRNKEQIEEQKVMILDGTKKEWIFSKEA